MNEWKEYKLGDIVTFTSGGTPSKSNEAFWGGNIPWISASSMEGYTYADSTLKITELGLKNGSRIAPKNSILLLVRGSILHQKLQVGIVERDVAFNQDVKCLQANEEIIDPWFLLFWFKSEEKNLLNKVESTGIGAGKLDTPILKDLLIKVPPINERRKLNEFFKAIQGKIELNRKMNQTLEAMAQAIFKSWFVDFDPVIDNAIQASNEIPEEFQVRAEKRRRVISGDVIASAAKQSLKPLHHTNPSLASQFPASFVFNETLGKWIPEGWKVKSVGDLSKKIFSGGTPSTSKKEYWNGSYNWFSSGETRNTFITGTEKTITKEGIKKSSTKLAFPGDILIASAGQGNTRGQTSFNCIETYINQSVVGIRAKDKTQIWLFFNLKSRYDEMRMISDSHSIRGSLTTKLLKGMYVIVPPKIDLLEYFDQLSKNSIEKIVINKLEIETLTQLRDRLLPELISGRVRVNEEIMNFSTNN